MYLYQEEERKMSYNKASDLLNMLVQVNILPSILSNPKTTSASLPSRLGTLID